jgi:phosphoribosylamine--glycine ligase
MRVLLLGSGAREHALARAIAASPFLDHLTIAPGNPGMHELGSLVALPTLPDVLAWLVAHPTDLVVIGPEAPLAAGWSDAIRSHGIAVFGPSQQAARLESSKAFAKSVMHRVNVPTAGYRAFHRIDDAVAFVHESRMPWVVKADGLAAGKGVIVAETVAETIDAIQSLGSIPAGQQLLLEERLYGPEVSLIAICDGTRFSVLPAARDHKRLGNDDTGPNTGGMGTIAPLHAMNQYTAKQLGALVIQPVLDFMRLHDMPFVGALYAGVMLTEDGPKVIEYNARFGDPETQVILPLCTGDMLKALADASHGKLDPDELGWQNRAAACVVIASHGYPETPRLGDEIYIDTARIPANGMILHAGTKVSEGRLFSNGGRVLSAVGTGDTHAEALKIAYAVVDCIRLAGMQYRLDIGQSELP